MYLPIIPEEARVSPSWPITDSSTKIESSSRSRSSKEGSQSANGKSAPRRTIEDYQFIETHDKKAILGQGSYGTVKLAIDKQTGEKFAIKIMNKSTIFQFCTIDNLKREIKIQKRMNHPNICKLYHYFEDKQNVYLVLEYAQQGSLFHNLRRTKKFPEDIAFRFFYQTCLGIDHLHKNSIIHRDLKPENLLIDSKGDVKLCDFGWSAESRNSIGRTTFCGTVDYMPPEMIGNQPHDHRVDIWCLGILLYELVHGYAPFHGHDDQTKLRNIRNSQEIVYEPFIGSELKDLLGGILKRNSLNRLPMLEIFNHSWMKKFYLKFNINISAILHQQNINSSLSNISQKSINNITRSVSDVDMSRSNPNDFSFNHGTSTQKAYTSQTPALQSSNSSFYTRGRVASQTEEKTLRRFDSAESKQQQQQPYLGNGYPGQYSSSRIEERYDDEDEYFERLKRNSEINNTEHQKNKSKKTDETFIDRMLIAFGCISRNKK